MIKVPDQRIFWKPTAKIDDNDELKHSTKLLLRAECMAKGDKELQHRLEHGINVLRTDKGEQASTEVRPLAPNPPLDWRQFTSSMVCCLSTPFTVNH